MNRGRARLRPSRGPPEGSPSQPSDCHIRKRSETEYEHENLKPSSRGNRNPDAGEERHIRGDTQRAFGHQHEKRRWKHPLNRAAKSCEKRRGPLVRACVGFAAGIAEGAVAHEFFPYSSCRCHQKFLLRRPPLGESSHSSWRPSGVRSSSVILVNPSVPRPVVW